MTRTMTFCAGLLTGVALAGGGWLSARPLSADPIAPAPASARAAGQGGQKNTSRVVLENARVRVKEAIFYASDRQPGAHTHDLAHVGVVIDGGTLVFKSPDGKTETAALERGGVGYREANVTHEPINTGTAPVRVIEVELK